MAKFFRKKDNYRFTNRVHPKRGIASMLIAISLLIMYSLLFVASSKGHKGILLGVAGVLIWLGSIAGFSLAILSMKEEDIHYRFPFLGAFLNGLLILTGVALYFAGMATMLR